MNTTASNENHDTLTSKTRPQRGHHSRHDLSGGARAAIRAICESAAARKSSEPAGVRRELLGRIAVVVVRTAARAVHKRATQRQPQGISSATVMSMRRVLVEAEAKTHATADLTARSVF